MRYVPITHDAASQMLAADPDTVVRLAKGTTVKVESSGETEALAFPLDAEAVEAEGWLVVGLRSRRERVRITADTLEQRNWGRIVEAAMGYLQRRSGAPNAPAPMRLTKEEGRQLADRAFGTGLEQLPAPQRRSGHRAQPRPSGILRAPWA